MRWFSCIGIHGVLLLTAVATGFAAEPNVSIIAVPGSATTLVSTDELVITFSLVTEASSFSDAKTAADNLVERIKSELDDFADRAHVDSQVLVLRQKKISWSSKAKRLSHRVTVTIGGFEQSLPSQAVVVLDRLLALDGRLELTDMEGRLSDEKTARMAGEVLAAALRDATLRAGVLARETERRVSAPRVINAARRYSVSNLGASYLAEGITIHDRSFTAMADLVGEVEVSMQLVAEFSTLPM